jgi:hypothetical protein
MDQDFSKLLDHPEVIAVTFHPRPEPPGMGEPQFGEIFRFEARDGLQLAVRCHWVESKESPIVVMFHGNGEIAADYDEFAPVFRHFGLSLAVCDYRGYGVNPGRPSGSNLLTDAVDTMDAVESHLKEIGRTGPLYVMGRSLGTASALEIAHRYEDRLSGLIFDSVFCDTVPLLERIGLRDAGRRFDEADGFHNRDKISGFYKPVLFMHGQQDQLTPLEDAQELHALCPAKKRRLVVIPGAGHNDTFARAGLAYFQTMLEFMGHRPPRRRSRAKGVH